MSKTKIQLGRKVDQLLIERIPDYIHSEIKWIRKEYGDDEISEFLCDDNCEYNSKSPFLNELQSLSEKYDQTLINNQLKN